MAPHDQAELEGTVSRIVYTNPESHWTVLRITPSEDETEIAVVGTLTGVREGERLKVWGQWVDDRRFGRQLKVQGYEVVLPATAAAIERYLSSGMIAGVGPKTARLIVKRFGDETLDVIDKNPERLKQVKGVGKKKVAQLLRSWQEQAGVRNVMVFLQGLGMTPGLGSRIYRQYGAETIQRVRAAPYELAQDVWGIGFLKADRIAKELGIGPDDPERIQAGLVHVLREARNEGHVCLPRERLLAAGEALLGQPEPLLTPALQSLELTARVLVERPDDLIYAPDLHRAERKAAEHVLRLLDADVPPVDEVRLSLVLAQAESTLGIELADAQRRAVRTALASRVAVITGGPGTGKTTIVRAVVEAFDRLGESVVLCAPTGRAAKRLAASTGRDARTIHRLLEFSPPEGIFTRDENNPLNADVVVADEASMIDLQLFESLLRAISDGARLLLVGDVDQLPSVGPGAVLRDVIESGVLPVVALREIYRQEAGSLIVKNAHRILHGELPSEPTGDGADFYWLQKDEPEEILDVLRRVLVGRIPSAFGLDPVRDVQVLTPMHRGPLGSEGLNLALSELLNPSRKGGRFAAGDKVMQIKNNYDKEVYNGDVGFVERLAETGTTVFVRFDEPEPRIVPYELADLDQLVMAWAISIHKSQGSEYPAVIVPLHTQHYMMLRRNLVYTAVTRGKRLVVLIGSRRAVAMAVSAATLSPRFGRLAERLKELAR